MTRKMLKVNGRCCDILIQDKGHKAKVKLVQLRKVEMEYKVKHNKKIKIMQRKYH